MEIRTQKKLTYLQETKDAIKSALIEKGQIVSDTDTFRSYAEKILAIQGGGATVEDIISEQELTFVYDESNGVYTLGGHNLFNITSIALGKEYKVVWGSDEYSCTAVEGIFLGQYPMIGIGNPVAIGGENNNMPFAIGYIPIPDDGDSQYSCIIASLDGSASKRVRVYQEEGGGSCDAVVWFVTFIGADGTKLYRMPVLDGDDCKDPYTRGDIEKPTKESTVSQVFTYKGWALTEGGSADANALKAVTEDRTVYAAFTATARKYTVRFFDGETLLTSKQVAYGESATYDATKEGYVLAGWEPSPTSVTSNMDCYAVWMLARAFADVTWEQVTEIVNAGTAPLLWSVGDEKEITLTWDDGTTETCVLQIADFDDNGTESNGKPFVTLLSKGLLSKNTALTSNMSYVHCGADNPNNTIYAFLNDTVKPALPTDLQTAMKRVCLEYEYDADSGDVQYPDILIPHVTNIGFKEGTASSVSFVRGVSSDTYDLFPTQSSCKKYFYGGDAAQSWWISGRSGSQGATQKKTWVNQNGLAVGSNDKTTTAVCIKLFV